MPDYNSEAMTIEYCGQMCQASGLSNKYMGLEKNHCFCLESLAPASYLLSNQHCHVKCPGDPAELCGGKGAVSLHQLNNETLIDVLVVAGGRSHKFEASTVINVEGQECSDHGIPDLPKNKDAPFTVIEDHTLVRCGGFKTNKNNKYIDDCYALDLRRSEWTWDDSFITALPLEMAAFAFEYVQLTQKIYTLGGAGKNWRTDKVSIDTY